MKKVFVFIIATVVFCTAFLGTMSIYNSILVKRSKHVLEETIERHGDLSSGFEMFTDELTVAPTEEPISVPTSDPTLEPVEEQYNVSEDYATDLAFSEVDDLNGDFSSGVSELAEKVTAEDFIEFEGGSDDNESDDSLSFEYLPVFRESKNEIGKRIAITIDDCFQVKNLETIVDLAIRNDQKLTIFPIGSNLSKKGMADLVRLCYFDYGFEFENHTFNHKKIYRLSDEEMTEEIWSQQNALSSILGGTYQCHFLRLMGGDGDTDQRTHVYLNQLGYRGIAKWSYSGSDADLKHIKKHVHPGEVLLFHTTDRDTKILKSLLPWLKSEGYELVTLNELFGFEANEFSQSVPLEKPALANYECDYHTLAFGDYSYMTYRIQTALVSFGYLKLDGPCTGYYGKDTKRAVTEYQKARGLNATGEADETVQRLLLNEDVL